MLHAAGLEVEVEVEVHVAQHLFDLLHVLFDRLRVDLAQLLQRLSQGLGPVAVVALAELGGHGLAGSVTLDLDLDVRTGSRLEHRSGQVPRSLDRVAVETDDDVALAQRRPRTSAS